MEKLRYEYNGIKKNKKIITVGNCILKFNPALPIADNFKIDKSRCISFTVESDRPLTFSYRPKALLQ